MFYYLLLCPVQGLRMAARGTPKGPIVGSAVWFWEINACYSVPKQNGCRNKSSTTWNAIQRLHYVMSTVLLEIENILFNQSINQMKTRLLQTYIYKINTYVYNLTRYCVLKIVGILSSVHYVLNTKNILLFLSSHSRVGLKVGLWTPQSEGN